VSDHSIILKSLHIHPVKSCAGIAVQEALVIETGLEFDRAWAVVDEHGQFLSQRELPRLQLVKQNLRSQDLVLRAPGMLALHLELDKVEAPCRVQIWGDIVRAYDMGPVAAQWFTDFLGRTARLARFDPEERRIADRAWTGELEVQTAFTDAFPLLVISSASLAELDRRLAAAGLPPAAMERFRPNLVIDGLPDAHGEDFLDEIVFEAAEAPVVLKLVKPCSRCSIPDVDPFTADTGHAIGDMLAAYRADARVKGALTFGMNAAIVSGIDSMLRVGAHGGASIAF
jgi:uncharacterized protein YcbX